MEGRCRGLFGGTIPQGGRHSCVSFGTFSFQISARRPAILTEVFCGFPQSLQTYAGIVGLP
jgi:hypothetical protein